MDSFEGSVAYEELSFAGVKLHQLNTATGKVGRTGRHPTTRASADGAWPCSEPRRSDCSGFASPTERRWLSRLASPRQFARTLTPL